MTKTAQEKGTLPASDVQAMFDRVAKHYDLINTVMTAGLHHEWRERAVDLADIGPGNHVLDVACGSGDLAFELRKARFARRQRDWRRLLRGRGCLVRCRRHRLRVRATRRAGQQS